MVCVAHSARASRARSKYAVMAVATVSSSPFKVSRNADKSARTVSTQRVIGARLVMTMSRCIVGLPPASRVISRKPPAVSVFMSRHDVSPLKEFISVAARTNGKWLIPATYASCSTGSTK